MLKNIFISVVPHKAQRYPTAGDWQFFKNPTSSDPTDEALGISVSDTGNDTYNVLLIVHELIEALMCRSEGITQEEVDKWDMAYEQVMKVVRDTGINLYLPEGPGDCSNAPYHKQHVYASRVEFELARKLDVFWPDYEQAIDNLGEPSNGPTPSE